MTVLMTSDLKARAGEILDSAREEPQFIFRGGQLFVISTAEPSGVPFRPDGYFAEDVAGEDRQSLRNAAAAAHQPLHR